MTTVMFEGHSNQFSCPSRQRITMDAYQYCQDSKLTFKDNFVWKLVEYNERDLSLRSLEESNKAKSARHIEVMSSRKEILYQIGLLYSIKWKKLRVCASIVPYMYL